MTARWPRWALAALLTCTAAMYLWNLTASGYGNTFYAAAAQAGSQSWSAWFFGSLDAHDFITVDKPPGSLWVTGLSVRLFGPSGLAVLMPQALMGVGAVAVLYAAVRRVVPDPVQGAVAGLIAGAVLACTPAAALMFRFNNPDALLALLLTVAAYGVARAIQVASWRWLILAGVAVGAAFLTKMLQGFLVLPGFALAYAIAAPTTRWNRLLHLAAAAGAVIVSAGWWVLAVQLIPQASRPYVGGSTNDSVLDLALDYNGVGRLIGHENSWGATAVASMNESTGLHRLFTTEMANEVSWLLPPALVAVAFGAYLVLVGRLGRDEGAAVVSWGGWLLVTGLVFSFMHGTVHPYYTVALAPAIGALTGLSSIWAWRLRAGIGGRVVMACLLVSGGWWSSVLLRHDHFGPVWLPRLVASTCVVAVVLVLLGRRRLSAAGLAAGACAAAAGTVAFSIGTVATPHHGAIPNAVNLVRGTPGGGWTGDEGTNRVLSAMLEATSTPWSAATNGSQSAAALELATRTSVMAIGGWSDDPTPTLGQFVDDVRAGRITYYVEAGRGAQDGPPGRVIRAGNHSASHRREIADWVADHYLGVTVGTSLVYRLI